jgi:hypothetical protein
MTHRSCGPLRRGQPSSLERAESNDRKAAPMTIRRGRWWPAILAAPALGLFLGGGIAGAADAHSDASPVPHTSEVHVLQSAGQSDWYYLLGAQDTANTVTRVEINPLGAPSGCDAQRPLLVSLYNQDGHWIEDVGARQGSPRYALYDPRTPGRYLVRVNLQDPACAGIHYSIKTAVDLILGSSANNDNAKVDYCKTDRNLKAKDIRLSKHARTPALRRQARARLPADRAAIKADCQHPA